jgi:pimeloyl-ACP methyl ester carboxylesterase
VHVEHLRIPVGAGHLHAERLGRGGLPVVLLHGFGTCAFLWRGVAPQLANAGYTALSLDMLGYGESDRPDDAGYGLAAQVEYVDRALAALRIPQATIVAQDIGCIVALLLAARRPRQITRLVLLSPPDPADLPPASVRAVQRGSARTAISANELFGAMPLMEMLLGAAVASPDGMSEALVARYTAPFVGGDGVSHLLHLARSTELADEDLFNVDAVSSRTLLVHGDSDHWSDPGEVPALARRIALASTQIVALKGVGHLIAEDAPDALAQLLLDWLATP